jgi:hypothetical protein
MSEFQLIAAARMFGTSQDQFFTLVLTSRGGLDYHGEIVPPRHRQGIEPEEPELVRLEFDHHNRRNPYSILIWGQVHCLLSKLTVSR